MRKRILSLIMILSLIIGCIPIVANANTGIKIGDYLQIGTYYGEPILWRCVDIDENGPLILSDKIICLKPFDASGDNLGGSHGRGRTDTKYNRQNSGSDYWGDSNMRSWLNSTESAGNVKWLCGNPPDNNNVWKGYNDYDKEAGFLTNFSSFELSAIKTVTQKSILDVYEYDSANKTPNGHQYMGSKPDTALSNYDTAYSEEITDTMFLLDLKQVKAIYDNSFILGDDYYIGHLTYQAAANSEKKSSTLAEGKICHYWLRTPYAYGSSNQSAEQVYAVTFDGVAPITLTSPWGVRPAFYLNDNATLTIGNGTETNPYTVDDSGSSQPTISVPTFTMQNQLNISLGDLPQILYVRGQSGVTFTTDNNDVIALQPTNERSIFETAAISGVYVTGLTPGTATITATAPDGTSSQCIVTVEGKVAETISDELVLKAKICADNAEYQYMRNSYRDPSAVLVNGSNLFASNLYQNINNFIDFFGLSYSPTDYYEVALMDMIQNDNTYYETVKDVIDNDFLRGILDKANEKIHDNMNANKVNVSGLNCFDIDKFFNDISFLDAFFAAKNVSESMYKKFEQIYALSLVTDKQIKALEAVKATTLNDDIKKACDKVIKAQAEAAQETANEIALNTSFAGFEELGEYVGKRGWNALINLIPGMPVAKVIVEGGKLVSNNMYNADTLSTDLLTMAAASEIQEAVKSAMKVKEQTFLKDSNIDNALEFMATADFYKAISIYGCDAALEFEKDLEYANNVQDALKITSKIFPSSVLRSISDLNDVLVKRCDSSTIEEFKNSVTNIRNMIEDYNFYNPYGNDIANYIRDVVSTTPSEWAKPYIDKAIGYGLLDTDYQNNYQNNITRAEFCTLLTYLIDEKSDLTMDELAERAGRPDITVQFDDTLYYHVSEIARLGIINGTGNNKFEPLGEITRQQAARILSETAKVLGYDTSAPSTDLSGVADWAKDGVNFVVDKNIMTGTDNGFEPDGKYTKEQAITTMVRFYENLK